MFYPQSFQDGEKQQLILADEDHSAIDSLSVALVTDAEINTIQSFTTFKLFLLKCYYLDSEEIDRCVFYLNYLLGSPDVHRKDFRESIKISEEFKPNEWDFVRSVLLERPCTRRWLSVKRYTKITLVDCFEEQRKFHFSQVILSKQHLQCLVPVLRGKTLWWSTSLDSLNKWTLLGDDPCEFSALTNSCREFFIRVSPALRIESSYSSRFFEEDLFVNHDDDYQEEQDSEEYFTRCSGEESNSYPTTAKRPIRQTAEVRVYNQQTFLGQTTLVKYCWHDGFDLVMQFLTRSFPLASSEWQYRYNTMFSERSAFAGERLALTRKVFLEFPPIINVFLEMNQPPVDRHSLLEQIRQGFPLRKINQSPLMTSAQGQALLQSIREKFVESEQKTLEKSALVDISLFPKRYQQVLQPLLEMKLLTVENRQKVFNLIVKYGHDLDRIISDLI
jgi:hypothetical protein